MFVKFVVAGVSCDGTNLNLSPVIIETPGCRNLNEVATGVVLLAELYLV